MVILPLLLIQLQVTVSLSQNIHANATEQHRQVTWRQAGARSCVCCTGRGCQRQSSSLFPFCLVYHLMLIVHSQLGQHSGSELCIPAVCRV